MVYCNFCKKEVEVEVDDPGGLTCCMSCGRVLDDVAFSSDVTFTKGAGGESTVDGHFVSETGAVRGIGRIAGGRLYGYQIDSHEKSLSRGRQEIAFLVDQLQIRPRDESVDSGHRLYKLALQRNFTRGRRTNQVAAACLYIVCRQDSKPFMLIDFSDALQVNLFTLGAVFLQLCRLLRLEEHPVFQRPVDPSLYIHRFADRLGFARRMHSVATTALQLIKSMKRDWMQTGRRPSGICGAALYIAAHINGFERTKKDVVKVVHIGEATLAKRVKEFSLTASSALTVEEFEIRAQELDAHQRMRLEAPPAAEQLAVASNATALETTCDHIGVGEPPVAHFVHGMCKACYLEFLEVAGGMERGEDPPAYTAGVQRELAAIQKKIEDQALLAIEDLRGAVEEEAEEAALQNDDVAQEMDSILASGDLGFEKALPAAARHSISTRQSQPQSPLMPPPPPRPQSALQADLPTASAAASAASRPDAVARKVRRSSRRTRQLERAAEGASEEEAGGTEEATTNSRGDSGAAAPAEQDANAMVLVVAGPTTDAGPGGSGEGDEDGETLSDIDDEDIAGYLHSAEEVRLKEVIWTELNRDYLEAQAAKDAAASAASQADAERRAREEEEAAADAAPKKRGRGRPLGSKTKPRPEDDAPPAETPQEAARRMLDNKKLSSKINYNVLDDLFSDAPGASGRDGGGAGGASQAADAKAAPVAPASKRQKVGAALELRQQQRLQAQQEQALRHQKALKADAVGRRQPKLGLLGEPLLGERRTPAARPFSPIRPARTASFSPQRRPAKR